MKISFQITINLELVHAGVDQGSLFSSQAISHKSIMAMII